MELSYPFLMDERLGIIISPQVGEAICLVCLLRGYEIEMFLLLEELCREVLQCALLVFFLDEE